MVRLFPIQVLRIRERTRDVYGRHAVSVSVSVSGSGSGSMPISTRHRVLTCVFCQGDQNDGLTCDAYDLAQYGPLVAMQNHLRREHLGPEYQGDEHYTAFQQLLRGGSQHVFDGAYVYFLADRRPYQFAGDPGQFQEWVKWNRAGQPRLSINCTAGHHQWCYGRTDEGIHCGCPHCNHPEVPPPPRHAPPELPPLPPPVAQSPDSLNTVNPHPSATDDSDGFSMLFPDP